jgi:protein-disulfide isomerase
MVPYLGTLEQKSVKVACMSPVESDEELTRKQRREQARADRKAMEDAAAAAAVRRTRLTQLGVVGAVVVVAVVVILIATGGGKAKTPPKVGSAGASSTVAEVQKLIGGIPQSGNVLGSSTAPLTLQYFGDLECPICQKFTLGALPTVVSKWVRTGKLKIEYRSLETATREPETFKLQQVAAYSAGKQSKAWYFIETFYHEQGEEDSGYVTEKYIQGIASQVPGLNLATWTADRSDPELANEVTTDAQAANNNGFTGTPSFLIGHTGGPMSKVEYSNPEDPTFINEAVEKLLKA